MNHSEIEPGFRPQLHYFLMILVWGLVGVTIGLYLLFVANDVWRPHVIWWLLSTGAIGLATIMAAVPLAGRFWHRSHRNWAVAVFMLTVAPLIWFAAFTWSLVTVANDRGDLQLTLPVRAFGLWCTSYFELEARWRHPRLTEGELVQLFDDGNTPNVDRMVVEMDAHIRDMLTTLEQPAPKWKTSWVRGSLFGQDGRAVGLWAICDTPEDNDELVYLDKHEVAHTLITSLCGVDVDMPMLLAEGWAQSQSFNRSRQILSLLEQRELGSSKSLMELTSEEYYGRSISPVYSHGGALAHYLLERFGGATFHKLYRGVRRSTFDDDVQKILGVSWQEIDQEFWLWLESQRETAIRDLQSSDDWVEPIVFKRLADEALWKRMVAVNSEFESSLDLLDNLAFEVVDDEPTIQYRLQVVIENESAWIVAYSSRKNVLNKEKGLPSKFILLAPNRRAYLLRSADGSFIHDPGEIGNNSALHLEIQGIYQQSLLTNRLSSAFMMEFDNPQAAPSSIQSTIESIRPGDRESDPWTISYTTTYNLPTIETQRSQIKVDPASGFNLLQMILFEKDNPILTIDYQLGEIFENGTRLVVGSRTVSTGSDREDEQSATTIRRLTPEEIADVKLSVEAAVANVAPLPGEAVNWNGWFINPLSMAIAWPALALLILGIDQVGERVKIRVAPSNANLTEST